VKRRVAAALVISIALGAAAPLHSTRASAEHIESFDGGAGWINSAPLTSAQLQGKVVLVDFWEYTCINCLRTLPYLREWYRRYRERGFVIVGVHSPEFDFSGQRNNVAAAAKRLDVAWPIVLDPHMTIWKRYGNNEWPHEFLYDQTGRLVESFAGEGGYPQTEARIQGLLKRSNPSLVLPPVMTLLPQDSYDKPGAVCYPQTPELLVGRGSVANAPAANNPRQDANYAYSGGNAQDGSLYLQGYWRMTTEAAVSGESNGFLLLRYHAIQVVAVMRPEAGSSVRVDVTQDGRPFAKHDAGRDIRYDSNGGSHVDVNAPRAYELLMNATFGEHELKLSPKSDGLGIYDVAFESCEVPQK
jgi:thiol-disulfide isomerase/thioredoxin